MLSLPEIRDNIFSLCIEIHIKRAATVSWSQLRAWGGLTGEGPSSAVRSGPSTWRKRMRRPVCLANPPGAPFFGCVNASSRKRDRSGIRLGGVVGVSRLSRQASRDTQTYRYPCPRCALRFTLYSWVRFRKYWSAGQRKWPPSLLSRNYSPLPVALSSLRTQLFTGRDRVNLSLYFRCRRAKTYSKKFSGLIATGLVKLWKSF